MNNFLAKEMDFAPLETQERPIKRQRKRKQMQNLGTAFEYVDWRNDSKSPTTFRGLVLAVTFSTPFWFAVLYFFLIR